MKKAFRIKLVEFCKSRTMKSSPDLFHFYVISAGQDMANDAGRATTCRCNFKAPWLQTERTKTEEPSEKMSFNGETGWRFQTKKTKKIQSSHGEQNKSTTRLRRQKLNMNHVARKNLTEAKLKKGFRMNCSNFATLELRSQVLTCSTFIWSRLVMTWPMTLAGLPRAGAISKPHDYKQNVQKWRVSEKMSLTGETVWRFTTKKFKDSTPPMENKAKEPQDPKAENWTWTM